MTWGTPHVDDYKPTWRHFKAVVDQARIIHGESIKPVVHPCYEMENKENEVEHPSISVQPKYGKANSWMRTPCMYNEPSNREITPLGDIDSMG